MADCRIKTGPIIEGSGGMLFTGDAEIGTLENAKGRSRIFVNRRQIAPSGRFHRRLSPGRVLRA